MAKKEGKSLTAEEAKEKLTSAKEKLMEAKDALKAFCKENGVKATEDHSDHDDEKLAKKWKKLKAEVDEKQARVEKYTTASKDAKKSGGGGVKGKYNYPKDVKNGADKKKYRTEIRAKAKKAGVTVDEYLKDPEKHAAAAEKPSKKDKKKEKKNKKAEKTEEAPKETSEKKKKKKPVKKEATEEASEAEGGED
jgi:hypothetical protein